MKEQRTCIILEIAETLITSKRIEKIWGTNLFLHKYTYTIYKKEFKQ